VRDRGLSDRFWRVAHPMRFRFVTSTPLNVFQGSGTYAGISALAKFLKMSGQTVDLITPTVHLPVYTAERIVFNKLLRLKRWHADAITVGFDMDGYSVAGDGRGPHIASIKGVIADEMRFESGLTRATMRAQAYYEKLHVQRANLVIVPSAFSAERIRELYGIANPPKIVPELIDLAHWRSLSEANPATSDQSKFVVLTVCRFYPRKRVHILLGAAERLRDKIPGLEIRVVGDGPEAPRLHSICQQKSLQGTVNWLGNISQAELAREYNRCDVFCLPSVQEAFGIVLLEAMAHAKPIVAARAAAVPEVAQHAILAEPDDEESLAEGIERLYARPELRATLGPQGAQFVKQFDGPVVAELFLREIRAGLAF